MSTGWKIVLAIMTISLLYLNMYAVMIFGWGVEPASHGIIFICWAVSVILQIVTTKLTE